MASIGTPKLHHFWLAARLPLAGTCGAPVKLEPIQDRSTPDTARAHILAHGWNSTCYQLLNEGIEHWWTTDQLGLVGFVRSGGMAIVAGAPVCAEPHLSATVKEWEQYAESQGLQVCYFGAEARLQKQLASQAGYVQVILGSQPEWHPIEFVATNAHTASLRAQLNRARNKGVTVVEWQPEQAENHPDLRRILKEWLDHRGLPTLHFLVEPNTLGDLRDRRLFVAELGGDPVGFVTLCPIPAQQGWLTEQFVRGTHAPNGTVELMLFSAAQAVGLDSSELFTMGIVPLIHHGAGLPGTEPKWLKIARRWAVAHLTRFYNFRGLHEFKAKFNPPHWQPVVVIVRGGHFGVRHLRAIGAAFTRSAPELALVQGLWRAIRVEITRARRRLHH